MTPIPSTRIFDGHNDTLFRLYLGQRNERGGEDRSFLTQSSIGHLDLPRARQGDFGGGFFAVFVPPQPGKRSPNKKVPTKDGYKIPPYPAIDPDYALTMARGYIDLLAEIEAASDGDVEIVTSADRLEACLQTDVLAAIIHFEGAEPLDPDLKRLPLFYDDGLRSIGPVWSRPNAFGHGVPFRYPHSPDTGPGLTEAGKALVRACNELGILLDLAHLNAKGFWDVASLSDAPLVSTHTAAHALCPTTRNLTDRQLDAVGDTEGVVGITFGVADLRADGQDNRDTPLQDIVRHVTYISERIGVDHVALGSDFDGNIIPQPLGDVTGLPALVEALREAGFDDADLRRITHGNWLRVLRETWK